LAGAGEEGGAHLQEDQEDSVVRPRGHGIHEKGKLGKITGVKIKELMLWINIVEVYVPEASPEKVTSKSSCGLSKTLDAAAFALWGMRDHPMRQKIMGT